MIFHAGCGECLPATLTDAIAAYGLRYFKLKLCGDVERDVERLAAIAAQLQRCASDWQVTMQKVGVIGLGRFGLALAESLAHEGIEVIAIDARAEVINLVKDKVALAVSADATDVETLR